VKDAGSEPALIERFEVRAEHKNRWHSSTSPAPIAWPASSGCGRIRGAENCGAPAILDAARVDEAVANFYAAAQHGQG
jgi:hypothetical protein